MTRNLSSQPAAIRQRIYRRRIKQHLGKRAYTFYLTWQEASFVRTAFARKFGCQATIKSKRACPIKPTAGPAEGAAGREATERPAQQMELLSP